MIRNRTWVIVRSRGRWFQNNHETLKAATNFVKIRSSAKYRFSLELSGTQELGV